MNRYTQKAFTLVELAVVMVIIGILATIAIVSYRGVQERAIITQLQSDLHGAAAQLASDKTFGGGYPATADAANGGAGLPKSKGTTLQYTYTAADKSYCLTATSERKGIPAFMITSGNTTPREGVCPGHSGPAISENGGVVTTLAGSDRGYVDGTGTAAQFALPMGVAIDASGVLYVVDTMNRCIRKVTPSGEVTTFAGSCGYSGYTETDGTGTAATFVTPQGIAIDASGMLYVSTQSRIRKVTPEGVVTTLTSGTGGTGIVVNTAGEVYVAKGNGIRKVTQQGVVTTFAGDPGNSGEGSADGTGTAARFYQPTGLAISSSGTLYVGDTYNNCIRKITPEAVVTTLAGTCMLNGSGYADGTGPAAKFTSTLYGVAVDSAEVVYVSDKTRIRKITQAGVVTTLVGSATSGQTDGTGATATFMHAYGLAVNQSGVLYVTDENRIRVVR